MGIGRFIVPSSLGLKAFSFRKTTKILARNALMASLGFVISDKRAQRMKQHAIVRPLA
jgi:hypothetical protein